MFQPPLPPEPPPPLPNGQQIAAPQAGGPVMPQQPWGQQPAMQQYWHQHYPPPQQPWGHQQLPPWGPPHPLMMMQHQHWQQQHWQHQQWHHQQLMEQQHQQRQQWHQQQQQQQQQQWMQQPQQQHFPGPSQLQQPALPPQPSCWPAHGQQPPAATGPQQPQQQPPPALSGPDASPQLLPLPPPAEAAAAGQAPAAPEQPLPPQPPDPPPPGRQPPLDLRSLLLPPGRTSRPKRLLLLLRGLPGSGKSHLARLIRQVELSQGAPAPRCHSLDDYFMVEAEQEAPADEQQQQQQHSGSSLRRPGTPGAKRRLQLVQHYVHDAAMEGRYWCSLLKALGRSLGEGVHGLVLLDAPALSAEAVKEAWSAGQQAGYEVVVVAPLATNPQVCFEQNIHGRSLEEVAALAQQYEPPPATYTTATATALLAPAAGTGSAAIDDVDMAIEDLSAAPSPPPAAGPAAEPSPAAAAAAAAAPRSRWEDGDDDGGSGDAADAAADGGVRPAVRPAKKARLLLHVDVGDGGADAMDAIDHQALLAGVNLELEQLDAAEEAAAAAAAAAGGGGGRAGGLASASSMSQGGSLTSGGGSKGILKGPSTPVSAKKKVRWPDEQQPAPGVAQAQEQQPRRQAARPLAEVYWLDGLGRDGAGWRDDSPDEEAFAELGANVGAASAAAAAGSGRLARHSFAQQVQAEHRSEHNMFRTILLGPSAAPTGRPAVGPANKHHL